MGSGFASRDTSHERPRSPTSIPNNPYANFNIDQDDILEGQHRMVIGRPKTPDKKKKKKKAPTPSPESSAEGSDIEDIAEDFDVSPNAKRRREVLKGEKLKKQAIIDRYYVKLKIDSLDDWVVSKKNAMGETIETFDPEMVQSFFREYLEIGPAPKAIVDYYIGAKKSFEEVRASGFEEKLFFAPM